MINWRDCIVPSVTPIRTLCEVCGNACGGCSWSEYGVQRPVPGWDAVRNDIRTPGDRAKPRVESYAVLDCPEFVLEERYAREYQAFDRAWVRRNTLRRMER